jgi:hypothetical protein
MKVRPRITVSENIEMLNLHEMSFQAFRDLEAFYGVAYANLRIYGEAYGYDGGCDYYMRGDREENDAEYGQRIAEEDCDKELEKKEKRKKKEKELIEYERLKKKYG